MKRLFSRRAHRPQPVPADAPTGEPTDTVRFERGGQVYASDGPVGTLRNVVVDGVTGTVTALSVTPRDDSWAVLVPPSVVVRTTGSAVFLSITREQFEVATARAPHYDPAHYAAADVTRLAAQQPGLALPDRGKSVLVVQRAALVPAVEGRPVADDATAAGAETGAAAAAPTAAEPGNEDAASDPPIERKSSE